MSVAQSLTIQDRRKSRFTSGIFKTPSVYVAPPYHRLVCIHPCEFRLRQGVTNRYLQPT
jgi:hypothetical protein